MSILDRVNLLSAIIGSYKQTGKLNDETESKQLLKAPKNDFHACTLTLWESGCKLQPCDYKTINPLTLVGYNVENGDVCCTYIQMVHHLWF